MLKVIGMLDECAGDLVDWEALEDGFSLAEAGLLIH